MVERRKQKEIPNQNILDSIGSPNAWTPQAEDAWHNELRKMTNQQIENRFLPSQKLPHTRRRG